MLKLSLNKHLRLRNLPKTGKFFKEHGFTHWVAYHLSHDQTDHLSFYDLERLCNLFKCTPNDLFEWVPDEKEENAAEHPLAGLLQQNASGRELNLGKFSYAQLQEIAKIIAEKK